MKIKTYDILKYKYPEISVLALNFVNYPSDMIVPVFKSDFDKNYNIKSDDLIELNEKSNNLIAHSIKLNKFDGSEETQLIILLPDREIILLGCGEEPSFEKKEYINEVNPGFEKVRMLGILSSRIIDKLCKKEITIGIRGFKNRPSNIPFFIMLTDGIVRGFYKFNYKKQDDEKTNCNGLKRVILVVQEEQIKHAEIGIQSGISLGKCVNFSRAVVDEPSNILYPQNYVELIKEFLKDSPCDIEVWDLERVKKENMGCFYAVAKGNEGDKTEARFVIIRSKKKSKNGKIALVGKGITFDTGGYNLKTVPNSIAKMKKDMGGSASVIAATKALLDIDIDIEIVTAIPLTESSISRSAYHPGDVVTAYNGKSVEILNTDAEGRLVLADALAYISENENPDYILDASTLTSSCFIAFGLKIGGFMGTNPECNELFAQSSRDAGESFWEFPLSKKYRDGINGKISDLSNINSDFVKYGGTITAGLFLREFIGNCKNWIHIDMSAPIYALTKTYLGETALGFSVATIVRYVERLVETKLSKE